VTPTGAAACRTGNKRRSVAIWFGLEAGELMVVGGWENIATVENRYYKSGQEHEESALDRVERG